MRKNNNDLRILQIQRTDCHERTTQSQTPVVGEEEEAWEVQSL